MPTNTAPRPPDRDGLSCAHPAKHVFAWIAYDGMLCAGCSACGVVLAGAADPIEHPEPTGQLLDECHQPRSE